MSDTPEKKSFERLYLVSEEELEKINQAEKPFLSYTQIYNSIVKSEKNKEDLEGEEKKEKLNLTKWLTFDSTDGKGAEESAVRP
jgi:hypothetical protein